jgi:uncharacterized protein
MKPTSRPINPRRLDVAAFAASAGELLGSEPLESLGRLSDSVLGAEPAGAGVHWQAEGEQRAKSSGDPEIWLHLTAQGCVNMQCQRCLAPVAVSLDIDRWVRFVRETAQAEALDAEMEDDVLELQRQMDLLELIEDELLLGLPLVPRHEECPEPLPNETALPDAPATDEPERPNPFAALARLKKDKPAD